MPKTLAALILRRLREPSSLAGLVALLAMFGVPPGVPELVAELVAAGAGLAAILLPDGSSSSSRSAE